MLLVTEEVSLNEAGKAVKSDFVSPVPKGLRLVMIGDSLTRYQYLSLVYFLKNGVWIHPNGTDQSLVKEDFFSGWSDFYNATNTALAPMEYCDCYRPDVAESRYKIETVENRFFYDKEHDNRVIFITAFGHMMPMHGRWNASTALSFLSEPWQHNSAAALLAKPKESDFVWALSDWKQVIEEYVSGFEAKFLLFNAGWWMNRFHVEQTRSDFIGALKKHSIQPIWRTTNYDMDHTLSGQRGKRDELIRHELCGDDNSTGAADALCIDLRWTEHVASNMYCNSMHFVEPVYRVMNEELLELMGHTFPPSYRKQRKEALFEG